ncbi:hypothetical protein [Arenimonas donghaensis]|uniref:Uncharacterized protein n=1 Tax=Arenimonas donghaensis DSM 18148 = HO3-R19 TaxID=1121014 RepID=A0A087ML02_9GAMM|nr:hypothetical protein [Arenimonas donghaensis]KFL37555.1 hypothetical protein N788_09210 [Arenimonas donghaensis DSM 18148 = HO3-R19]
MNANKDWDALSATWQQQATQTIDVEALRREAVRRGRTLRLTVWLETGLTALVVLVCAVVALAPSSDAFERGLFAGLAVLMTAYQAYMVWLRRREWSEAGLDATALLDLELRRCATTLYYWRFGMWSVLGLWLALFGAWLWMIGQPDPNASAEGLMGGLYANVVVIPAIGVYGLWRSRQARRRRERLLALRN